MALLQILRPTLPILIGASIMLTLSMGLRQSLGLFMQPLTQDIRISVSDFTLALAVQNLAWGFLQPFAGALTVRYGFRAIMMVGRAALCRRPCLDGGRARLSQRHDRRRRVDRHVAGLHRGGYRDVGGGARGAGDGALAPCSAWCRARARSARCCRRRSARSSTRAMAGAWALVGFVVLALLMIPAAWYAGRVDKIPLPPSRGRRNRQLFGQRRDQDRVLQRLLRGDDAGAYFVCGMQLVFLTTHLPSYLAICGMDPMLSAQTLGMIGGFNVLGSIFFGWAGQRWNKLALLGGIYIFRSIALAWYFTLPPTPATTLLFGAIMGFLWMGVGPLVAGAVAEMFGLKWQAMIQGLAFMSHQVGSFLGAFGGGVLYDALGSYTMAWRIGVALGLAGGIIQVAFALIRPSGPPQMQTA